MNKIRVDIIIPVFNEGLLIQDHLKEICSHLDEIKDVTFALIVVDDGSVDETLLRCEELAGCLNQKLTVLSLARNFGKESAIYCGLAASKADASIVMDSDLQHPPELILRMISLWRAGARVVEAVKEHRGKESLLQKFLAGSFYSTFQILAGINMRGHTDFKLLDRLVVDECLKFREQARFFRGIVSWMSFSTSRIPFSVPERKSGGTRWSRIKLLRMSLDAIVGFSSTPLYLILYAGIFFTLAGIVIAGKAIIDKLNGVALDGFTTVILTTLITGGVIIFSVGLLSTYVAKIFEEVKRRPQYIVDRQIEIGCSNSTPPLEAGNRQLSSKIQANEQ